MEKKFWDEKWKQRQIGFHQPNPHKQLVLQYEKLAADQNFKNILVPLCGKTLDLIWLSKKKCQIVGIEFNKSAILEFFSDNNLNIQEQGKLSGMPFYRHENITLIEGDFFEFKSDIKFDFIYDRAAIVAIDPETRPIYMNQITQLSAHNATLLMISFEYDQKLVQGPPFCVPRPEISKLFGDHFNIRLLNEKNEKPKSPKFVEAGLKEFKQITQALVKI